MNTENAIVNGTENVNENTIVEAPVAKEKKGKVKSEDTGDSKKEKKGDLFKVGFEDLVILEGANIRQDYGDITELAASIAQNGIKVPLTGYRQDGKWVIVAGHRRHAALELLWNQGVKDVVVPIISAGRSVSDEQFIIDTILTNSGKDLTPLELAFGVQRLIDVAGWEDKQLAEKLGVDKTYVQRLYKLANAPKKFQNLVQKGTISATLAMKIMQGGEKAVEQFLADYAAGLFHKEGIEKITAKDIKDAKAKRNASEGGDDEEEEDGGEGEGGNEPVEQKKPVVNSWKELQYYLDNVPVSEIDQRLKFGASEIFKLLYEVRNNKVNLKKLEKFFGVKVA